jgi:membrane associated rhomboid family serine protease
VNRFQSWYGMQPPALRALLTINVVVYVVWLLLALVAPRSVELFVIRHLALNPELPGILIEPWQLITYNFLHIGTGFWGLIHILFNMLWLVWIGRDHEETHGSHQLLAMYVITGIGGGVLTVLLHAAFPGVAVFGGPVHGASASVLGIMTAVAIMYPDKSIGLLFIGTVRLLYIVIAFLVLDILFAGGTSVSAHLGGALTGLLFARAMHRGIDLSSWARIFFRPRRRRRTSRGRTAEEESFLSRMERWLASRGTQKEQKDKKKSRPATVHALRKYTAAEPAEDSLEGEVDRILDKISEQGYDALTDEEKRILYEASRREQ